MLNFDSDGGGKIPVQPSSNKRQSGASEENASCFDGHYHTVDELEYEDANDDTVKIFVIEREEEIIVEVNEQQ